MEVDEAKEAAAFAAELKALATKDPSSVVLPKGLSQLEVRVPTEEKDAWAYYCLLKVCAAALFVTVDMMCDLLWICLMFDLLLICFSIPVEPCCL